MTFDKFLNTYKTGKSYAYNGTYKGECVSLVKLYIRDVLGGTPQSIGNAKDYWTKRNGAYIQSLFKPIANTPEFVPQKGDVFVRSSGIWGHVGIVISATQHEFKTIEQNAKGCRVVKRVTHTDWKNINFLRPKNQKNIKTEEKKSETVKPEKVNYTKILLIGNSYTYYNGYGEMLSKLCGLTKKNVIVVRATKGGADAHILLSAKLDYKEWINGETMKSGKATLSQILKYDFEKLGKSGKWDFIVLQNNTTLDKTCQYDVEAFNYCKGYISKAVDFIINVPHYSTSVGDSRLKEAKKAQQKCGCSLIDERGIVAKYGDWKNDLTIKDKANHASARGMYLNALCTYAKIYGVGAFSKDGKTLGIPLYNADNKTAKTIISDNYKAGQTAASNSITKSVAAKLQYLVRSNKSFIGTVLTAQPKQSSAAVMYFKKYTGKSNSIVDALNAIGADSSFEYRKKIAVANGIKNYAGVPPQNNQMLNKLKSGTLIKP